MSANIPRAGEVDKALKVVMEKVKASQKALNQTAARHMSRGNYVVAEELMKKGKEIQAFLKETQALRARWRGIRGKGQAKQKKEQTPLWGYYQPVLQALAKIGGEEKRKELEPVVGEIMEDSFKDGDLDGMAHGRLRWQVTIGRLRKPLVEQGWLEPDTAFRWCITAEGRKAAEASAGNLKKLA